MSGLSRAQHGLYRELWNGVVAVQPEADRLAWHAQLGLPESRADWSNEHFDKWKRACLAVSRPDDLDAQLVDGKVKRRLFAARKLLAKMTATEAYAEQIVRNMGFAPPIELLKPAQLEALIVALKKQQARDRRHGFVYRVDDAAAPDPEDIPF